MAFDKPEREGRDFPQRQMFKGNWKCAECGAEITELPFQPDPSPERPLYCRECHQKRRSQFRR
jgi:CxxC-x17-CxxC domain-containing protein